MKGIQKISKAQQSEQQEKSLPLTDRKNNNKKSKCDAWPCEKGKWAHSSLCVITNVTPPLPGQEPGLEFWSSGTSLEFLLCRIHGISGTPGGRNGGMKMEYSNKAFHSKLVPLRGNSEGPKPGRAGNPLSGVSSITASAGGFKNNLLLHWKSSDDVMADLPSQHLLQVHKFSKSEIKTETVFSLHKMQKRKREGWREKEGMMLE